MSLRARLASQCYVELRNRTVFVVIVVNAFFIFIFIIIIFFFGGGTNLVRVHIRTCRNDFVTVTEQGETQTGGSETVT